MKYQEQWDRVKRYYKLFEKIDQGRLHDCPSDYYQDEVYAFFLNCYHLKDWIKNDKSVGVADIESKVEKFINNNKELRLCADICNSIKHLERTSSRSNQDPQFAGREYKMQSDEYGITISAKYIIDTSSGPVDAFQLATKCLELWENFIVMKI